MQQVKFPPNPEKTRQYLSILKAVSLFLDQMVFETWMYRYTQWLEILKYYDKVNWQSYQKIFSL